MDEQSQNEWIVAGQPVENADWIAADGDPWKLTPARLMAWQKLKMEFGSDSKEDGGTVLVFDFGREVLGHVELEVDAEPGQIIDVGYDEWQQPNGMIDLYRTNPFVHTVDRYVLRGGLQKITGLNPRGGHVVQVVMYPAAGAEKKPTLNSLNVIETRTLKAAKGMFADGNPTDEAIWRAALATVIGSAEDVYSDSPWRERGAYIGDFTVNQLLQGLIDADLRIARRCLQLFAQSQLENGQFACVAPAHHRTPHEDFSLIWVLGLWEHWAMSGDKSIVEELWPHLLRLWESSVWQAGPTGLWGSEGMKLFIDWGVRLEDRQGVANAVLNALRILALEKSAALALELGHTDEAEAFQGEALKVREAFASALWIAAEGRYAACIESKGTMSTSPAAHSNLLAWSLKIGSASQLESVQSYLFDLLEGNLELGLKEGRFAGHIELYFFRYLLSEMAERGFGERALSLIRTHWGPLVEDGFGTLPECFYRFKDGMGSRCHGWSGYPAVWYTKWVLGLRQEFAGDPDHWILDPLRIEGIDQAEGSLPHRLGLIRVAWTREPDCSLKVEIEAPDGVRVRRTFP
ncbi:family 78 glycoside hydrolase catalytic domain [Pelagicoccus sp. SDUM812005]|uniref:family 78 glycoside hydrolase catalytic domain n=1 Tax=Pelagicoccus sp. SDUM812005 TaxID=3041257 RepID=UPI00280F7719|nr:family 78 glycoside hydrolase catalytic domain [Pelagicoccus sp. SDUM812005]MDQ8181423.1 family 78 glycoside hydrolase catalytic domain [Pelagicoccus sp. SDUM812005]